MSVVADGSGGPNGALPPPPGARAATNPPVASGAAPGGPAHRRAAITAGGRTPGEVPTRRRWGRVAAGSCLALLGGLLFAVLYLSAGQRVDVLVAAHDIGPFETIERGDLRIERVAADPDVATIEGANLDDIVGRTAAAAIPEGGLLAPDQVYAEDARIVGSGEAVVGIQLAPGQAPEALRTGDAVIVGIEAGAGPDAQPEQVSGWVLESASATTRAVIAAPRSWCRADAALAVGTAAAGDHVSLMVTGGG